MFKQHLEMIGRNETPSKKAKFWQSYVRSLKGNYKIIHFNGIASSPARWQNIPKNKKKLNELYFWFVCIGSDDIRAHDAPKLRPSWRPLSADIPLRSIYDEPSTASERITGAGYRYLPVHRETYGYSPRPIYSHHYNRPSKWHLL